MSGMKKREWHTTQSRSRIQETVKEGKNGLYYISGRSENI